MSSSLLPQQELQKLPIFETGMIGHYKLIQTGNFKRSKQLASK